MSKVPKIIQKNDPVLRKKSKEVITEEFGGKGLSEIIKKMILALDTQDDGVAIAAPQIGINLRIFVVSWKIFVLQNGINPEELSKEEVKEIKSKFPNKIFINPEVIKTSKKSDWIDEGCLSVRPLYGEVKRFLKCRVRSQDEYGKFFEIGANGLLAQIFQHEIDHLDGILFIDKARNIHELTNDSRTPTGGEDEIKKM